MTCHCVKALLSIYAWQQNFDVNPETDVSGTRPPTPRRSSGVELGFLLSVYKFKQPLFVLILTEVSESG